jgi:diacylglycerol kinase (ATP)
MSESSDYKLLKVRFIFNPHSGKKDNNFIKSSINKLIDKSKFDFDIVETDYAGHATQIAIDAVQQDFDMVVAVGGDGSINEVVQGILGSNTILGILPAGSGNGFATHLGFSRDIEKSISTFNTGHQGVVDICFMNEHSFINLAGIGFDAKVAYKLKKETKRGFQAYFKLTLQQANKYKFRLFNIKIDDIELQEQFLTLAIANAPMYGYNFEIAPEAKYNDGFFEVVLFKKAPLWRYVFSSWRMLAGNIHKSSLATVYKAKKVEVECLEPKKAFVHIDGEGFKFKEKLVFTIREKAVKVWLPGK